MEMERTKEKKMVALCPWVMAALILALLWVPAAEAKSSGTSPIKPNTAPPSNVAKAPVCDIQSHPKITKVTPDSVKPGDRATIKGQNFGTRECFHGVSFGAVNAKDFKYVNDSALEATVPNIKPGLVPVNILTEAGSSEFVLLVQTK